MEDQFIYQDFDLLIEPGPPGSYRARVLRSPAGESAPTQFMLPFSEIELENFVLKIGRGGRRTRGPGRPESAPLKDFGGRLYGAVFQGELRDALQRSLSQTRAQHAGLRLRLRLADAPELAALPWEFLYDPRANRFLAQSRRTPLVRYLDLPDPPHPLSVEGPLRLLVMISNPSDYADLDSEQEWSLLTGALAQQQAEGRVIIERLAANMSTLRQRLRQQQFHVFHFIGHGRYRPDWDSGVLVMEDRNGRSHEVTGEELGGLLNEYDQTRLAVLNACEGARSDASDPFAGVAQSLIQQGLPAVVAMQFEITDDAAIVFAREFYGATADGYPLEAALAEARGAIRDEGNLTEWGTPVLYSRAPDGRLFDWTRGGREEAEERRREMATYYALACTAAEARDWDGALTGFTKVVDIDVGYQDVQERMENVRTQQQIASWQAEVRRLHQIAQWAVVVEAGERLQILDPAAADPDGLVTSARAQLAAEERTGRLDADYQTALSLLDAGNWWQAIDALERVAQVNPTYRATPALLDQARRHLTDTGLRRIPEPASAIPQTSEAGSAPSLAHTLTGHTGSVYCVAFSPDGGLLASCGKDKSVRLWDPATGEHRRTLAGHTGAVLSVAFSPDGGLLASCGKDKSVRLWDLATGEHRRTLAGHTGDIQGVAFSPDGRLLASCSADNTVRLWDPATGERQRTLTGHTGTVLGVAFSPDGLLLASSSADNTVRLWDPATGEDQRTLTGHTGDVRGVAFSPDGRLLASSSADQTVRLWDPAAGEDRRTLTGHINNVRGVAFSPDGRLLASCSADKTVRLWDPASGKHRRTLTGHKGGMFAFLQAVAFSPDCRLLASCGNDQTVRLWDVISTGGS